MTDTLVAINSQTAYAKHFDMYTVEARNLFINPLVKVLLLNPKTKMLTAQMVISWLKTMEHKEG